MWNYLLFSALVTLVSLLFRHNLSSPISVLDHPETQYDYIIVGAGTAGCVMASRLSEDPNVTVLLVEAGGYFNWLSSIPLAAPALQKTHVDWGYKTESQAFSSRGLWDHQQRIPRGKGLGGSGQLNYLVHSFGRPEDYSNWPRGWSYADLQPYFKKVASTMHVQQIVSDEQGLVQAMDMARETMNETDTVFIKAQSTLFEGSRWSTYQSHLQMAWNRRNLHIVMNTVVSRILLDSKNVIDGVEIQYEDGMRETIEAKREVIVCAGAIATPQLLMVSGIGPEDELKKHKIPLQVDVPAVGKNYADHFNMPVYVNLESPVSITLKKMQSVSTIVDYFLHGTGLLASNGIMGMARLDDSAVILAGVGSADEKLLKDLSNYRTETFRSLFPSYSDITREGFLFMSNCQQPKSRGNVTLRSASVFDRPMIEPAFLQRDEDIACTIKAIRLGLTILETPLFREFGAEAHVPDLEECKDLVQDYRDDAFAECAIRVSALTSHHPCGTCRMGDSNADNDTVVDEFLRVYGIEGLRIVDASVLPGPISGTPNSVIIALAEKAADIVLNRSPSSTRR
ncbi:neither inactivation nor afterpotential protein G [Nasonia vitripennis]|uniref:Glucose-methanol-choline oxidoreductase N-terminal domain-containing protein n=1 Tax=Nasonia vitripennis TaxID=7425 RepID=A0A7M7G9G6_NASVI|nr:neither inactivation nor afterpotential protein G [Nasonia vitripennis]